MQQKEEIKQPAVSPSPCREGQVTSCRAVTMRPRKQPNKQGLSRIGMNRMKNIYVSINYINPLFLADSKKQQRTRRRTNLPARPMWYGRESGEVGS